MFSEILPRRETRSPGEFNRQDNHVLGVYPHLPDAPVGCGLAGRRRFSARHLEALGARPVPEGLVYSSDRNPQRLDEFGLMRLTGRGRSAVA